MIVKSAVISCAFCRAYLNDVDETHKKFIGCDTFDELGAKEGKKEELRSRKWDDEQGVLKKMSVRRNAADGGDRYQGCRRERPITSPRAAFA